MFLHFQSRKGIAMFDTVRYLKRGGRSEGRSGKSRQHRSPHHRRLRCEALETRTMLSGLAFVQQAELPDPSGVTGDGFGSSVAVSGNTMVVGAYWTKVGGNTNQGVAYVFTGSGSSWTQTAELTASNGAAGTDFGFSVAISGNTVVVGAHGTAVNGNTGQGAAYVFVEPSSGWSGNLTQTAELTASDGAAGNLFGRSVAISGNTVVVGAWHATVGGNANQGAAYVFVEPSSGWANMTQTAKLTASDGTATNYFGRSVAISADDTIVVGAYDATVGNNTQQGAAYVFTEPSGGWTNMSQTAKLTASGGAAGDAFGISVAIDSETDMVVVGAFLANSGEGAAYVFTEPASGWASVTQPINQTANLTASDLGGSFGNSVAVSAAADTILVGASSAFGGNFDQGAAYVFESASGVWTQTQKLTASDGATGDGFGQSVAISGNTLASTGSNAAYVFGSANLGLSQTSIPPDNANLAYDQTIAAVGGTGTVTLKVSNISGAIKGLTVPSSGTGSLTISGTPTATGTETFTVTATDPAGDTASANYSITVNPALTFSVAALPATAENVAIDWGIGASGGTGGFGATLFSASVTSAIPGISVIPTTPEALGDIFISGTPTATGTETITATVTDALHAKTTVNYFLTVTGPSAITSSNWSGYAVSTSAGAVTDVKGSWIEPALQSPSAANTYSAFWVGIDGYSSGTVEQIGTDLDTNASGNAVYYAWYEMYPSSPVELSMTIHPGDQISGEVKYTGSNKFTLTLTDVTTNTTFSTSQTLKSAKELSAEWIAEAPSSSKGVLPLADFGAVSFSAASATISGTTGPIDSKAWPSGNPIAITMVGSSGTEAYPSSLVDTSGTSAFSVSYAAAQGASQGATTSNGEQKAALAAAYLQYESQLPSQQPDSERSLAVRAVDLVLMEFGV